MTYRLPLASYRILDLGPTPAVAYASRLLGDAGAEVIVIERPPPGQRTAAFHHLNRDKLGCTLDFATPRGTNVLRRLVARSHVVVEGFEAAERERLGLTYDALRAVRADVVVASIAGSGRAIASLLDVVAGTAAAAAVCLALLRLRDSGERQHVEVDARDCALSFQSVRLGVSVPAREELLANERLRKRGFFEPVSSLSGVAIRLDEPGGPVREDMPSLPWRFSLTPCHVRLPAPQPGEHNRYVLGELAGLSEAEIEGLLSSQG